MAKPGMKTSTVRARRPIVLWALLALPATWPLWLLAAGNGWGAATRPTGDIATKLMIVALAIGPLAAVAPHWPWLDWMRRHRRSFGVAAFLYALFHMIVFALSIGRLDWIVQGMAYASMWTGWLAFAGLAVVAAMSNDASVRRLGRAWKRVQRLVYPAALLTLAHWLLLSRSWTEALVHFIPLGLLFAARDWSRRTRSVQGRTAP